MATTRPLMLLAALLIPGCSSGTSNSQSPTSDAGGNTISDAGPADAGPADTGPADTGPADTGTPDAGPAYPAGPYGGSDGGVIGVGDVLAPTLEWQVYAPNASSPSTLKIHGPLRS